MQAANSAVGEIDFTCDPSPSTQTVKKCDLIISCPVLPCLSAMRSWRCKRCQAMIGYQIEEKNFHCRCGVSEPAQCLFQCNRHEYRTPNARKLKRVLSELKAHYECNILILGETGVGKSTFINAFANYIAYSTLEEALNGPLHTLIPNAFTITDDNYESVVIKNGPETQDEDFTAGQSATQGTKVHKFHFGSVVLRIIDTPGIGDVRGAEQDKKNFEDILNTIAPLDALHGIIVLLKPNSARLTLTFRYCVEELLGRLHASAKDNIIFGFTNTRSTNFRPGDTMPPLLEHLAKTNVPIKCKKENVFCFDSEGYRFMAAHFHGIKFDKDLFDSYSKSWDFSVKEIARLLSYIQQLTPHSTKATLSLNNARLVISKLGKPLAEMTKTIVYNLVTLERDQERIKHLDENIDSLRNNLMVTVHDLVARELGHPRTVCTHIACVTMTENYSGCLRILFTTVCHDPCHLEGVQCETPNNSAIGNCAAMISGRCKECSHDYRDHMHITYELISSPREITNETTRLLLNSQASGRQIKAQMIRELQEQLSDLYNEQVEIEKIAATLGVFLSHNSITNRGDPHRDYLRFLIEQETKKESAFRDVNLLQLLEMSARVYDEELDRLTREITCGRELHVLEVASLHQSIDKLLCLPFSGPMLSQIGQVAIKPTSNSFREVCYRFQILDNGNLIFKALSSLATDGDKLVPASTDEVFDLMRPRPVQRPIRSHKYVVSKKDGDQSIEQTMTNDLNKVRTNLSQAMTTHENDHEVPGRAERPPQSEYWWDYKPIDALEDSQKITEESAVPQSSSIHQPSDSTNCSEVIDLVSPTQPNLRNNHEPSSTARKDVSQGADELVEEYIRRYLNTMENNLSEEDHINAIIEGLKLEYYATVVKKHFSKIHILIQHLKSIEADLLQSV